MKFKSSLALILATLTLVGALAACNRVGFGIKYKDHAGHEFVLATDKKGNTLTNPENGSIYVAVTDVNGKEVKGTGIGLTEEATYPGYFLHKHLFKANVIETAEFNVEMPKGWEMDDTAASFRIIKKDTQSELMGSGVEGKYEERVQKFQEFADMSDGKAEVLEGDFKAFGKEACVLQIAGNEDNSKVYSIATQSPSGQLFLFTANAYGGDTPDVFLAVIETIQFK